MVYTCITGVAGVDIKYQSIFHNPKKHVTTIPFAANIHEKKREQHNMCGIHVEGIAICIRYGVAFPCLRNIEPQIYP